MKAITIEELLNWPIKDGKFVPPGGKRGTTGTTKK